jgi:hypothetical protein
MTFIDPYIALWATATLALTLYLLFPRASRSRLPLPPGPRKLPLVGNLFDLPPTFEWEAYVEWSRKFGEFSHGMTTLIINFSQGSDIIHLNLAGTNLIVLSSFVATEALLEKRSAIYSDRYANLGDCEHSDISESSGPIFRCLST